MNRALFSAATDDWSTPRDVYESLNDEFRFTLDPCPLGEVDHVAFLRSWQGERVFCNPPYSEIGKWIAKAYEAELAVFLVPSRTDTRWWHDHAMTASEIRFIRGRLKFGDAKNSAPFPSVILVFARKTSTG